MYYPATYQKFPSVGRLLAYSAPHISMVQGVKPNNNPCQSLCCNRIRKVVSEAIWSNIKVLISIAVTSDSALSSSSPLAEAVILLPLSSGTEDQQLCIRFQKGMCLRVQHESDHEIPPSRAGFLKVNSVGNAPTSLFFQDHVMPTNVDLPLVEATTDTMESLRYISSRDLSTLGSNSDDLHPRYRVKKGHMPVALPHASDLPPSLLSLGNSVGQQIDIKTSSSTDHEPKPNGSIRDEDVLCSSARLAEHPIADLEQGSPSFTSEAATIAHSDSIDEADGQIRDKARKAATEICFGVDDVANQMLPGGLSVDRPVTKFTDLNLDFFSAYNGIVKQLDVLAERYGFHSIFAMAGDDPHKDVSVAESYETSKAKKFFEEKLHCPGNRWIETHLRLHIQNNTLEEGLELHRRHLMTDSHFTPPEPTVFHLGLEPQYTEEPARQPGHRQGNALSLMNSLLDRHGIKVTRPNVFPWRSLGKYLGSTRKLLAGWPIQVHLPMLNNFDGDAFSKLPEELKEMLRVALVEETLTIEGDWTSSLQGIHILTNSPEMRGFSQGRI
ncbi:hypothetical protein EDD18DRAFT_1107279 [Armillaria luteobubalina]|uniref:Uncharacterized protein n=1 Tax=Armillaria luteobubalina TaxID=153913 RepID=A0AA39Q187_9AGAR|nr:hypothetical protein EDD18DRAFT_1107279 [Armillaria luteobubalina]